MRIAWVTPANLHSAIGRAGVETAEALAGRGHEVEIWASEHDTVRDLPRHPTRLPLRHISEVHLRDGAGVDLAVVNIGDNFLFHAGALAVLEAVPSIGVFHDVSIHNFFAGWLAAASVPEAEHRRLVEESYGPEAWPLAEAARAGQIPLAEIAARIPMTEWLARRCKGALAHADFYRGRLEAACPGPVDMARLPWRDRRVNPLPARRLGKATALTVGVMNPNKCCDAVIRALGVSEALKAKMRYVLAGPIDEAERKRLSGLAARHGVELSILGPVTDAELERELGAADVMVCLRKPVLEGASASAIEAMLAGRPTLVANAGFYAELPDDLVVKLDSALTPAAVAAALETLLDASLRRRMGKAAAAWAADTFTPERYLDVLEPLLAATAAALPTLRTAAQFGEAFGRMKLKDDDPAVGRALAMIETLGASSQAP